MDINYYFERHPKQTTIGIIVTTILIIVVAILWNIWPRDTPEPDPLENYQLQSEGAPIANTDLPHFFQGLLPRYYSLKNHLQDGTLDEAKTDARALKESIEKQIPLHNNSTSKDQLGRLLSSLEVLLNASSVEGATTTLNTLRTIETTVLSDFPRE